MKVVLYRNARARDQLELFIVSAAASLLSVRLYLELTGFPQIGGGGLHIAHMLFGGLLMLAGLTVALSFLGSRAQRLTALLGGVGFGVFIDELGKFITRDNDYFFRPAIGLIYAIFVIIALVFSYLTRTQRLSSREYQLNALEHFEEAIARDMDPDEKKAALQLLQRANPRSTTTLALKRLFEQAPTVAAEPHTFFERLQIRATRTYEQFWRRKGSSKAVQAFFITESLVFFAAVVFNILPGLDSLWDLLRGQITYGDWLIVGQVVSAFAAAAVAVYGALKLPVSRLEAFEMFRRATLINLLLTQFFVFSRIELGALPGFFLNLALLGVISLSLAQEHRLRRI